MSRLLWLGAALLLGADAFAPLPNAAPAARPRHNFAQLCGFVSLDTKMTWEEVQKIARETENQKAYGKAICIYKE